MSDRFETPSWDAEPDDLGSGKELVDEAPGASASDEDLDASRENVLDGWPVSDPPADEAASEPSRDGSSWTASKRPRRTCRMRRRRLRITSPTRWSTHRAS